MAKVYKLSIGVACALEWPSARFVIQVLDDSTDPVVKVRTVRRRPDLLPLSQPPDLFAAIFVATPLATANQSCIKWDPHVTGTRVCRLPCLLLLRARLFVTGNYWPLALPVRSSRGSFGPSCLVSPIS